MTNLLKKMVGAEGVEPPTSAMFRQRSATELYAYDRRVGERPEISGQALSPGYAPASTGWRPGAADAGGAPSWTWRRNDSNISSDHRTGLCSRSPDWC